MERAFDRVVEVLDPAMLVVTTAAADDGERSGCLVGFHGQTSIEPLRYGTWISLANHTHGVVQRATHLALHLVPDTAEGRRLAQRFGTTSGDQVDKLAGESWQAGPGGVPLLDHLDARVVVRIDRLVDAGGDHLLVVGEPVDATPPGGPVTALRLHDVLDLTPGHAADDT